MHALHSHLLNVDSFHGDEHIEMLWDNFITFLAFE